MKKILISLLATGSLLVCAEIMEPEIFLDRNVRPNAEVVTKSEGIILLEDRDFIEFKGVLGAVKGRIISQFVGFTGIEIPIQHFTKKKETRNAILLTVLGFKTSTTLTTISFQIVTINNQTFSFDAPISNGEYILNLQDFRRSIRGRLTNEGYMGTELNSFRIFVKRSKNNPTQQEGINIKYQIDRSSLAIL